MINNKIKHLIVDSGGFIKNAPLKDIAENIYTVNEVVNEIRDKNTRQRLQILPYELRFITPTPTSLSAVTEFSKKTGDYAGLSATDLKLMALSYQLTLSYDTSLELKLAPTNQINWNTNLSHEITQANIPGFYVSSKTKKEITTSDSSSDIHSNLIENESTEVMNMQSHQIESQENINNLQNLLLNEGGIEERGNKSNNNFSNNGNNSNASNINDNIVVNDEESSGTDDEVDEEESDDETGWVTPANLDQILNASSKEFMNLTDRPIVACLTTDFAMQNVLIQMGLKVISVNGYIIKRAHNYVLRCFSCFKISKDTNRDFCHHCGNMSLQKVAMSVNEDGEISYQNKKIPSTRGTRYSLPMPKGGKHARNPILCADQLVPQQRLRKKITENDLDNIDLECPFAVNDVKSRANKHGFHVRPQTRKNPNDNSQMRKHK